MCTDRNQVRPSITLWQVLGFWGHAAMSPNPLFVSSSECDPGIPQAQRAPASASSLVQICRIFDQEKLVWFPT